MSYFIYAFDGLELSSYAQLNDEQNMGTGQALTSFIQVPGGGFYDNYGSNRSPQGIRPITKNMVLVGDTSAALLTALDAMRAKLGVRGKLTVQYDDGSLRWQWARLTSANTPRTRYAVGNLLPCELTFITASQIWYGVVVTDPQWSWGDLSWTFGDGTVELGESGTSTTMTATGATGSPPAGGTTQDIVLANNGNRDVINLIIHATAAGGSTFAGITFTNTTNGYVCYYEGTINTTKTLRIDTGAMTVRHNNSGSYADAYANFTANDVRNWLPLSPGNNTIRLAVAGNATQLGTIAFEYYHHYA